MTAFRPERLRSAERNPSDARPAVPPFASGYRSHLQPNDRYWRTFRTLREVRLESPLWGAGVDVIGHSKSRWFMVISGLCPRAFGRSHDALDHKRHRNPAGELCWCCERAGELRGDTSRTGAHRLLPWPKSALSWTIGSCRWQGVRAGRRRVVSDDYRNRPS